MNTLSETHTPQTYSNVGGSYADYTKKTSVSDNLVYTVNRKSGSFLVSSKVSHAVFGDGIVLNSEGSGAGEKVTVQFKKSGIKKILAGFLEPR